LPPYILILNPPIHCYGKACWPIKAYLSNVIEPEPPSYDHVVDIFWIYCTQEEKDDGLLDVIGNSFVSVFVVLYTLDGLTLNVPFPLSNSPDWYVVTYIIKTPKTYNGCRANGFFPSLGLVVEPSFESFNYILKSI
jgi:hypothetical protein